MGWVGKPPGAAAAALNRAEEENCLTDRTITFASHSGMLRLDCHSEIFIHV